MKKRFFILAILTALVTDTLRAQELPRPSMSQQTEPHTLPTDYNMKAGPVLFNVTSSIEGDFIDNIGLSTSGAVSDFTLTPEVGIAASWPVTESNTLTFGTSLGYTRYLIHPQYDTANILVAPNSRAAFDVYTGNFKFHFHDDFSLQQDPVNEAALSNVVNFARFENDAGVSMLWDLNRIVVNLNYDHINFVSTQLQTIGGSNLPNPNLLDYSADQISGAIEGHMTSTLIGGVEGTVSQRTYDHYTGDYDQWSAGPFMKIQLTQHVKVQVSGGYQYISSPNDFTGGAGSAFPPYVIQPGPSGNGSASSYYFDVSVDHEVNKYYLQRFSVGHDISLGILGDTSDCSYVDYSSSWKVNRILNLSTNLSFQDCSETGGLVPVSSYDYFSAALQANFPLGRRFSGSIFYQFNDKFNAQADQAYEQNKLGFLLTYQY